MVLFCLMLSENLKIRIYKSVIVPVVLYLCEIRSVTLREVHRLRLVENMALRKNLEKHAEYCLMKGFITYTYLQVN
jgi:hypothetical protein